MTKYSMRNDSKFNNVMQIIAFELTLKQHALFVSRMNNNEPKWRGTGIGWMDTTVAPLRQNCEVTEREN